MKRIFIFAAMAISLAFTADVSAQKPKPSPSPTPNSFVTAEFLTLGDNGATVNKVRMDQPGVPYSNGLNGVAAQFFIGASASRDLVIRLDGSTRTAIFDFTEVSSGINMPDWISSSPVQSFKPQMNVLGAYFAKENCQPVSGVYNCNFVTRMNAGYLYASGDRVRYSLLWNPETENPRPVNSPEATSFVNVNYQRDALGKDVFTITPLPNCATRANNFTCAETDAKRVVAGLEKTSGKSVTSAGQYVMPFTLVVRPK
ncbi:MAG TPA: hypothetical protein VIL74_07975 [Pyrinomonadaceae bacterium]|jgi:hypothetical protein